MTATKFQVIFNYEFSEKDGGQKGTVTAWFDAENIEQVTPLAREYYKKWLACTDASYGKQFQIVDGNWYYHKFIDIEDEIYWENDKLMELEYEYRCS